MDKRLDLLRELIAAAQGGSGALVGQRPFPLRELRYALEYKAAPDLEVEADRLVALLRVSPGGIARSAFHTDSWNGVPGACNGTRNVSERRAK